MAQIADTPDPDWYKTGHLPELVQVESRTLRDLADLTFTVPTWQRHVVWTATQQVAFCETAWRGTAIAPILLWERPGQPPVVVDGQQRLTSLGCTLVREDGGVHPPSCTWINVVEGTWHTEPGPARWQISPLLHGAMLATLEMPQERAVEARAVLRAFDRIGWIRVPLLVLPMRAPVDQILSSFRSINRPGVPLTEEEVEALIAGMKRR